ncbi:MAG TPA: hypothetical protein VGM56_04165 [Byssovorax sp.]
MKLALLAALAAAIALPFACANDVGDQECNATTNLDDTTDDCPYGPPGGPKVDEPECATAQIAPSSSTCKDDAGAPLTFEKVYVDMQDSSLGGAVCSAVGACHGGPDGKAGIELDDPLGSNGKVDKTVVASAYNVLKSYKGTHDNDYISATDPAASWIVCNIEQVEGGGKVMPPSQLPPIAPTSFAFEELKRWVQCGALPPP